MLNPMKTLRARYREKSRTIIKLSRWVFLAYAVYHIYHQADQYEYLFSESTERASYGMFQLVKQVILQKPKLKAAKLIIATLMFDE